MSRKTLTLFDPALVRPALLEAFKKLDPRVQWRNPVMFVVYVGSAFTTALAASQPRGLHGSSRAVAVVHRAVRQLCRGHG